MVVYLARAFNRVVSGGFLLSTLLSCVFVMDACAAGGTPVTSNQTNTSNVTIAPDAGEIFDVLVDSDGNPVVFTNAAGATLTVPEDHDVRPSYGVKISGDGSSFINNGTIQHDGAAGGYLNHASGIFTDVDNAIIENNGTINTTGAFGDGILNWYSDNSTINVSGDITTSGSFGNGLYFQDSDDNSVFNSGTITVKDSTASILRIAGKGYTGLNFESSGTLALGSNGGSNKATSLVTLGRMGSRYYTGRGSRFKNTGTITRVTTSTPTIDMRDSSVLMLHGSNPIPPVAITLMGKNNIYVEDMSNPIPSGSSVTFEVVGAGNTYAGYYGSNTTFNSTSISGSVPSYVSKADNASVACDSGTELTLDADVNTIYGRTISELNVSEIQGVLKINTAFSKPLRSYFPQYNGKIEVAGSGSLTSPSAHNFDNSRGDFEFIVNTTSNGYINSNVEAGSSSAKYGTLRFMQGYTNPAYSSAGVSYGETNGNEFRGFANLALDGGQPYALGSNSVYSWDNIIVESGSTLSGGAINYSNAKLTNNGTISGNVTFGLSNSHLVFGGTGSLTGAGSVSAGGGGDNEIWLEGVGSSSQARNTSFFQTANLTNFSTLQVNESSEFSIDTQSDFFEGIFIDSTSRINHTTGTIGVVGNRTNLVNNGSYDITTLTASNAGSALIYGNYIQGNGGTLFVEVDATGSTLNLSNSKTLVVDQGDVVLGGRLNIAHVGNTINPSSVDSSITLVNVLDSSKNLSGRFVGYDIAPSLSQDYRYDLSYTPSSVVATLRDVSLLQHQKFDSASYLDYLDYLDFVKFRDALRTSVSSANKVLGSDVKALQAAFQPMLEQSVAEQGRSIREVMGNGYLERASARSKSRSAGLVKSYRDSVSARSFMGDASSNAASDAVYGLFSYISTGADTDSSSVDMARGRTVHSDRGCWFKAANYAPSHNTSSFSGSNVGGGGRSVAFTSGKDFVNANGNLFGVAMSYERNFTKNADAGVRGSTDSFVLSGYGSKALGANKSVDFSFSVEKSLNDMSRHISLNNTTAHSKYSNYYSELEVMRSTYESYGPVHLKLSGGVALSNSHYNAIDEAGGGALNLHISEHNRFDVTPRAYAYIGTNAFEHGPVTISPAVVLGAEVGLRSGKFGTVDSHFSSAPDLNLPMSLNASDRKVYKVGFESVIEHKAHPDSFNVLSLQHEKRDSISVNSLKLYHTVKF